MDGVGIETVNIPDTDAAFPTNNPVSVLSDGVPSDPALLNVLSVPRSRRDLLASFGADAALLRKWLVGQLARGTIVRTGYDRYARADRFAAAPAAQLVRPRPIYDALLAYLATPRRAVEIAAHINSTVPTATGHLSRLVRQGVVARAAYGVYVRANKCPAPPAADAIRRGRPVRERVAATVDQELSLAAVAKRAGILESSARDHLAALVRDGSVERVGTEFYRPTPPDLFSHTIREASHIDAAPAG